MKEKIFTKNFCFAFLALFSISMVMYMLMATITQYVTEFGAAELLAGLVSGMYVVGGMFSRLASGRCIDTLGMKKVALFAAGLHFVSCCFYPFISNLTLLVVVRFIHGLGFGAATSAIVTIGMSVLPKSRFGEGAGYFMMGTTLSVGLGPFVGGFVYDTYGAVGCFVLAVFMSFLVWLFLMFVQLPKAKAAAPAHHASSARGSWVYKIIEPRAIPISVVTALSALGYVGVMSFYRLYAEEVDLTRAFSYYFLIYAAILIVCRPLAGRVQDKYGDRWVCLPGLIAQAVGLFLLSLHPCVLTLVLCAFGCAMGYGALTSACNVMAVRSAPESRRSYAVTTFYLCCDVAMGFGPALLGAVVTAGGYHLMYYFSCAVTLLGLPLFLRIDKLNRRKA